RRSRVLSVDRKRMKIRRGPARSHTPCDPARDKHRSDRDMPAHERPPVVSDYFDTQSGERKGGTRIRVHIQVSFKIASKQTSWAALKQADPADVIAVPRRKPGSEAGCRKSAGSKAGLKAIFSI